MAGNMGALSQVANPAEDMIPSASGGNDLVSQMMKDMLDQNKRKDTYLQQQQAAYNRDLEQYAQMVEQSRRPENNEAMKWGSMSQAASEVAPVYGNLGAMIGRIGGAYGKNMEREQQSDLQNQEELTKLRQAEVRALEAKDQNAAMVRAMRGSGNMGADVIKVVDGKLVRYNRDTQEVEVLTGSQDQIKARLLKTFYEKRVAQEDKNALANAQLDVEEAMRSLGGTSVKGPTNNIPGVKSTTATAAPSMNVTPAEQNGRDAEGVRIRQGEVTGDLPPWPKMPQELSKEDQATASRLVARIQANPAAAENDRKTLQGILNKYQTPTTTPAKAPPLEFIDKPKRKLEEATGEVAGKALGNEHEQLKVAAESSSQLFSQLDLLKKLYATPNMPEGELANGIQQVRSGLKSIGIDVGEDVGAANLASSISGKMALLTRTAEGKNLMPGAMSDFEQKILRNLVPSLEQTAEGRVALIDIMQAMAKARMRFSEEANKMAIANRGILPPEWDARKVRLMKEEMARIAQLNSDIANRFKGAK